jgi:uroporphyrinogen decarboxylase
LTERHERVRAAINGEVPDRVPWSVWAHFPAIPWLRFYSWELANRNGEHQAKAHIAFLRSLDYKMDLLKVTPFFRSMAYHWGSKFKFTNNTGLDETMDVIVKEPEDWDKLWVLDPRKELRENLRCVEILARDLPWMPFIYTIASPMTQALHGVSRPETVYKHMKEDPGALRRGLETITETCIEFAKEAVGEGADGIFYGIGGRGSYWSRMDLDVLEEYTLRYDKMVLEAFDAPVKMLHICNNMEEDPEKNGQLMSKGWFKEYPVNTINWWDHHFTPASEAKGVYGDDFCIATGLDHKGVLAEGDPQNIMEEAKKVMVSAGKGGGFILAGGCTVTPEAHLSTYNAVGRAVEKFGYYQP